MKIDLQWTTNLDSPSNPLLLFPPPLLTLISSLAAEPSYWSLENSNGMLLCSLSWSTTTATVEPAASTEPASPLPSPLDDSGYCSPTRSPIPFNLPSDENPGVQQSPSPLRKSLDAATSTSTLTTCSSSTQTLQPATTAQIGSQTAPPPTKQTLDATVATVVVDSTSRSSQTPSTSTVHLTTQASFLDYTKISRQTTSPRTAESGIQASTTTVTTTHDAETQSLDPLLDSCTTDASTNYDPNQIDLWCRFCHAPISTDETPLLHLVSTCGATPEDLLLPLDEMSKELGQKMKLP